jgi:tetratricopeptide (TPR) repeat protein
MPSVISMAGVGRRLACVLLAASCTFPAMLAAQNAPESPPQTIGERNALAHASTLLDRWTGEPGLLEEARSELEGVLASNPSSAEAYFLHARYDMDVAMRNAVDYDQAGLEVAERSLDRALSIEPGYVDAYILMGRLHNLQGRPEDAWSALQQARKLDAANPLLAVNEADLLMAKGRYSEALQRCEAAVRAPAIRNFVRSHAEGCMIDAYTGMHRYDDVDAMYRSMLARDTTNPWSRGNYALFLLCTKQDADAAIRQATAALQLMDFGNARTTLAAALYARWAGLENAGRHDEAERAWAQADASTPGDPVRFANSRCGASQALPVLYALRRSGRASLVPPLAAVLLAAQAEGDGVPGVFALQVAATGHDDGEQFLDSEADYRDQRNLTVRYTADAVAAFRGKHGQDPETALKGRQVTVVGFARRVRIDFTHDGKPTGKYYYQTHVVVTDPAQVEEGVPPPPQPAPRPGPFPTNA